MLALRQKDTRTCHILHHKTLQKPTLQPTHQPEKRYQLSNLTNGGVTAVSVIGQDKKRL